MNKKTIRDIDLRGKKILLRVDYNVALENGQVADELRISQTIPTIEYLLKQDCRIILMSHLGRPEGKVIPELSLKPVVECLAKFLQKEVSFGEPKGKISLLENLRFNPGEEANTADFSRQLANLGEVFVNDAFGVCHRAQASTVGVTKFLPAVAGLLLEQEVDIIIKAMEKPQRPLVVIVGGAKLETKIGLIKKLLIKADQLLVGGAVANKLMEDVDSQLANGEKMRLPVDGVWEEKIMRDIGPKTRELFGEIIGRAKTIIWNGPMGMFEKPKFSQGTEFIYQSIKKNRQALSIVGGGDTLAALNKNKDYVKSFTHVSTGGGAMLELIEKGSLPGIDVLMDK
ncbi:MAG: phosphoglycerate kinase [Candidatus Beckwithbacteria bacterium]|nr:phosphoglycerate kinase [Candidatus Beckwithbacteria bacterium]